MSKNQPNSLAKENLEESFENEIQDIMKPKRVNIRDLEAKYSKILGEESAKDRTSDESTSESLTMDDENDLDLESLEEKMTTKAAVTVDDTIETTNLPTPPPPPPPPQNMRWLLNQEIRLKELSGNERTRRLLNLTKIDQIRMERGLAVGEVIEDTINSAKRPSEKDLDSDQWSDDDSDDYSSHWIEDLLACAKRPPQRRYPSAGYNFSRRPRTPPPIPPPAPVAPPRISSLKIADSENNKS